jgi:hypothetical protein
MVTVSFAPFSFADAFAHSGIDRHDESTIAHRHECDTCDRVVVERAFDTE